jgi:hypothetical protein
MNNLTSHEIKLLQDLVERELNNMTASSPAILVTQYLILINKLKKK